MKTILHFAGALSFALAILLLSQRMLIAQDRSREPSSDDMTVQTRGPIHEAYAQPTQASPKPGPVIPKKPPDPIVEVPPDQKPQGDNVVWIPGYWAWDQDRSDFTWVSGFWRVPPPHRKWVPGHWAQVDDGSQWIAGFWAPDNQQEVQYVEEPPASLDQGPSVPAPDDYSNYVPGSWLYRDQRFVWRPGYWLDAQPGYVWTPASYCYTPSGYTYVSGYWDYPLEDRGLLFAPVYFNRPLWETAGWYYQPSYCVPWHNLLSCLFVRPDWCHYYFGDYYGANYLALGYRPWFDYGGRYYDPLFGYYRWAHRDDPGWYRGLANDYRARLNSAAARPPRTFAAQERLLASGRGEVKSLATVQPLNQFHDARMPLTRLSQSEVSKFQQHAQYFRSATQSRQTLERAGHSLAGTRTVIPPAIVPRQAEHTSAPTQIGRTMATPSHAVSPMRSESARPYQPSHFSAAPAIEHATTISPSSHMPAYHPAAPSAPRHEQAAPVQHFAPTAHYSAPPTHSSAPPRPGSWHGGGSAGHSGGGGHGGGSHAGGGHGGGDHGGGHKR